jgi:glycerophosphoryl diester phosphodiesterase
MSFAAALELGYRYIETDVRCTADDKVIICHDARPSFVAIRRTRISDLTLCELRSAATAAGESEVPLLSDALRDFPGLRFNIDVKDRRAAELVLEIVRQTAAYDRVCIASFSGARIRHVRSHMARAVCTGAAVTEVLRFLVNPSHYAKVSQPAVLQLPLSMNGIPVVTPRLVDKAHEVGLPVHVWTLNDVGDIRAAIGLAVDGIMTDEPVLLKDELLRHNLWH